MSNDEVTSSNDEKEEHMNVSLPRARFSAEEDAKLVQLQQQQLNWNEISRQIGNRSPRQCRERFQNYLDPDLNKSTWTPDEDNLLLLKESEMGKKWKKMMPYFQNRSNVNIKNRFTTLQNRIRANERQQKELNAEQPTSFMNMMPMNKSQIQKMMNWRAQSQQYQQMRQFQAMQQNQFNEAQFAFNEQNQRSQFTNQMMAPQLGAQSSQFTNFAQDSPNQTQQMQNVQQPQYETENQGEQQEQSTQPQFDMKQNEDEEMKIKNNQNKKTIDEIFDDDQEIRMMWNFIDCDFGEKNDLF